MAVKNLGANSFTGLALFNFERQPQLKSIFDADLNPQRILAELEAVAEIKTLPGKTMVFFDEIQECPKAITALQFFYVIAAGNLLEF